MAPVHSTLKRALPFALLASTFVLTAKADRLPAREKRDNIVPCCVAGCDPASCPIWGGVSPTAMILPPELTFSSFDGGAQAPLRSAPETHAPDTQPQQPIVKTPFAYPRVAELSYPDVGPQPCCGGTCTETQCLDFLSLILANLEIPLSIYPSETRASAATAPPCCGKTCTETQCLEHILYKIVPLAYTVRDSIAESAAGGAEPVPPTPEAGSAGDATTITTPVHHRTDSARAEGASAQPKAFAEFEDVAATLLKHAIELLHQGRNERVRSEL